MAWPTFCVSIVHICRFCFIYCGLRIYAQSHSDNGHVYATAQWREDRLQQQRQAMKDNYDKICSENQKLMHCLPGSRKTRKREEQETKPWRKLETKPEWRIRGMSGCERQVWQEAMTRHGIWTVLNLQTKKYSAHSRHIFIPFFDTLFPLYVRSHHGLSKIIQTPKLYTHPRYPLLISSVLAQARPTMIYIH